MVLQTKGKGRLASDLGRRRRLWWDRKNQASARRRRNEVGKGNEEEILKEKDVKASFLRA